MKRTRTNIAPKHERQLHADALTSDGPVKVLWSSGWLTKALKPEPPGRKVPVEVATDRSSGGNIYYVHSEGKGKDRYTVFTLVSVWDVSEKTRTPVDQLREVDRIMAPA